MLGAVHNKENVRAGWRIPRYNLPMPRSYEEVRQIAYELPEDQRILLANALWDSVETAEDEAAWQKNVGEPEPGYEEWFRAGVEEALADTSEDVPHEVAMKELHEAIRRARRLKATA
jgi:hypothetical protein